MAAMEFNVTNIIKKQAHQVVRPFSLPISFFVVWQGIYDPRQTQEKGGNRGFILLLPQPAVLSRSDAGSDRVELAPCFVIQNCQTHYFSGCPMYGTCQNNVVCSLFTRPHSHFAEETRPHLCMDEPKRPTPVHRRLRLTQAVLVKLIPIGLVLTLGM